MSVQYLPSAPAPASMSIRSVQRSKSSMATSGKILSREYGGQFYELSLFFPVMTRAQFAPISAFLAENGGKNDVFFVDVPTDMAGSSGEKVGNFANYDNDWKLHMITATGPTTVTPPARAGGGILITNPVRVRCSLARDVQEIRLGNTGLIRFELDLVERL